MLECGKIRSMNDFFMALRGREAATRILGRGSFVKNHYNYTSSCMCCFSKNAGRVSWAKLRDQSTWFNDPLLSW